MFCVFAENVYLLCFEDVEDNQEAMLQNILGDFSNKKEGAEPTVGLEKVGTLKESKCFITLVTLQMQSPFCWPHLLTGLELPHKT